MSIVLGVTVITQNLKFIVYKLMQININKLYNRKI
jgi:hypothetical protein